jgi:bifunctional non-homologous end joining protein LigD
VIAAPKSYLGQASANRYTTAVPARPTFIEPCTPKAAQTPPKGEDWVFEAKWDGYRCLIVKDGKTVRLYSRNRTEWTDRLPGIASSFASFGARSAVIDGELCVCDAEGRPDFRALHRTMRERRPDESRLVYYAFDLLHANGADLTAKPLIARKTKLDALAEREPVVPCLFLGRELIKGEATAAS